MFKAKLRNIAGALCLLGLAFAPQAGAAHDFWIHPARFWMPAGAPTTVTLQVGDGPDRQRSRMPLRRITRFEVRGPGGEVTDLRGGLTLGGADGDATLRPHRPGLYVVALETDAGAESHLPADRFNAYAEDEGLTPALEARARAGQLGDAGSERYSRRAKTLVQVGPAGGRSPSHVTRPVGLLLEIVPEVSPYAARRGARLPVRVFYEGRPLANALVKLTDMSQDATPRETHRTDGAGRAAFTVPSAGDWRLNVVWTKPLKDEPVDFETVFSSLSFGFPPAR